MHAQITSYQVEPGRMDDRVRHTREVVLPLDREQPGFLGKLILVNRETNRTIAISLWEDEADLRRAFAAPGRAEQLGRHHFADGEALLENFEVAVQELDPLRS